MRLLREWLLEWPSEDLPAGPQSKTEKKSKRLSHHGTEEVTSQVGNYLKFQIFLWCLSQIPNSTLHGRMVVFSDNATIHSKSWNSIQIFTDLSKSVRIFSINEKMFWCHRHCHCHMRRVGFCIAS